MKYDPKKIEAKWQKFWLDKKTFFADQKSKGKKKFVLVEFPYPSGAGLHMGHMRPFIAGDTTSKYWRLKGFNTMYPMGWDAFGLPAENYAIKNKVHPSVSTKQNVANAKKQLLSWGTGFDWSREINTTDPDYYKWTQKLFLEFFKAGLAYEKFGEINWCPKDKTGLANEEVVDGKCERCGTEVEKKNLRQWYLKITDYAEKLLEGLKELPEWPESVKLQQENWIGRSEGVNLKCKIKDIDISIEMYDSIPQTFYAQTFAVIAPDHPLLKQIIKGVSNEKEILDFSESIKAKKSAGGFDHLNSMEGIFTGRYVHYPAGDRDIPLWVASYAVSDYGTGIVSCSAHDERDFAFAKKFNIPLKTVLYPENNNELKEKIKNLEVFYREPDGVLEAPEKFKGRKWYEVRQDVIDYLVENKWADRKVNYKLRDWVFSRQRYWGEPIPLVHCSKCGIVPVPEKDLPVKLPNVKNYEPTGTGESPLAAIESWVKTPCPKCVEDQKKTKYLVFDFDGVLGDTYKPGLKARMACGWASDTEDAKQKCFEHFTRKPDYARGHNYSKEELKKLFDQSIVYAKVLDKEGYKLFDAFISEIKKIKNTRIAIISSGSVIYANQGIKKSKLKVEKKLTLEDSFSKEEKFEKLSKFWKVPVNEMYYFTDSNSDVYELENMLGSKKIIGCSWGYIGYDELKKALPEDQILKKPKDIHDIFKPKIGRRETNTMPQWAGSSWYWLRYMDPHNKSQFSSINFQKYWSPVDLYFGGMEHTTLHLLYSRFWNLVFKDRGLVAVSEPYKKRVPHGIILGPDGEKMSKSRGNVVNPDEIVKLYGADTVRLYMMFLGPHGAQVAWNDKGIVGARRFIEKVFNLSEMIISKEDMEVTKLLHKTIKKVEEDIETFSFNTAVSALMIFVNKVIEKGGLTKQSLDKLLIILSPFIPHVAEEMWKNSKKNTSIFSQKWPQFDPKLIVDSEVTIVVQVNGKLRGQFVVEKGSEEEFVVSLAKSDQKVKEFLLGAQIKKAIYIKDKLVNFVI